MNTAAPPITRRWRFATRKISVEKILYQIKSASLTQRKPLI